MSLDWVSVKESKYCIGGSELDTGPSLAFMASILEAIGLFLKKREVDDFLLFLSNS